jgi:hypothetical protein
MANITVVYTPGFATTYIRVRNSSGQWWYSVGPVFETWNASHEANYRFAMTEAGTGSGVYEITTPASWATGSYLIEFFDSASGSEPLAVFQYDWDTTNDVEVTPAHLHSGQLTLQAQITASYSATSAHIDEVIDDLQTHGDAYWLSAAVSANITPVYTQIGTGEVLWNEIKAYQFESFGPYAFHVYDSQKPPQPVTLTGHSITLVCFDQDGTFRWQIEDCTVMGTYSNIVSVEADDANTAEAGNFKYVLRDQTSDKVLAVGRLIIETAADAE